MSEERPEISEEETTKDVAEMIEEFFNDPEKGPATDHDKSVEDDEEKDDKDFDGKKDEESEEEEDEDDREEDKEEGDEKEEDDKEDEEEEDEVDALRSQNLALVEKIESILGSKPQVSPTPPTSASTEEKEDVDIEDFLEEGEELDDVVEDKKLFNKVLKRVEAHSIKKAEKNILASVGGMVSAQIAQQIALKSTVDEFFNENEDLKVAKRTLGFITKEVMAEDPKKDLPEVLEESAKRVRNLLGIKKVDKGKKKTRTRRPAFRKKNRSSRNRPAKDKRSQEQREIDDLIDL